MVLCLTQWGILILLSLHLADDWLFLCLSSSQNSPNLITLPILPLWLLSNQYFIKPIWGTNLYSVEEYYSTVYHKEGIHLELVKRGSWSYPACLGMLVWGLRVIWIRYWLYWAFNKHAKVNESQFWFKQWSLDIEIRNANKHLYFYFFSWLWQKWPTREGGCVAPSFRRFQSIPRAMQLRWQEYVIEAVGIIAE